VLLAADTVEAITALLSAAAVLVAAWAAWQSSRSARAAIESAKLADRQFRAEMRPILTDVPRATSSTQETILFPDGHTESVAGEGAIVVQLADDDGARVSIPLRNHGRGVARITETWLELHETVEGEATDERQARMNIAMGQPLSAGGVTGGFREVTKRNVPAGETTRLSRVVVMESDWRYKTLSDEDWESLRSAIESGVGLGVYVRYADLADQQWVTAVRLRRLPGDGDWIVVATDHLEDPFVAGK
jgi:hypothetical protein